MNGGSAESHFYQSVTVKAQVGAAGIENDLIRAVKILRWFDFYK